MKLRLVRGLSYSAPGLNVTRENPYVDVDDERGAALIAGGYFREVAVLTPPASPKRPSGVITSYTTMNKAELMEAAREKGLNVTGKERKETLVAMLNATIEPPYDGPEVNLFVDGEVQ